VDYLIEGCIPFNHPHNDELHSLLIVYFRIFAPLTDDHVIVPHAIDVT